MILRDKSIWPMWPLRFSPSDIINVACVYVDCTVLTDAVIDKVNRWVRCHRSSCKRITIPRREYNVRNVCPTIYICTYVYKRWPQEECLSRNTTDDSRKKTIGIYIRYDLLLFIDHPRLSLHNRAASIHMYVCLIHVGRFQATEITKSVLKV